MKSKGLVLILVLGLVLVTSSAKAATMIDNQPGNGAIVYFQANASGIGTVFSIFNSNNWAETVHLIIKDQCSQYKMDVCLELSANGAVHYGIFADADGAYLRCINGACRLGKTYITDLKPDDDGYYRGYVQVTQIYSCAEKNAPVDWWYPVIWPRDLIVSTALLANDWWVGINASMIQGLTDEWENNDLTDDGQIKARILDEDGNVVRWVLPEGPNVGHSRFVIGRYYQGADPNAPGSPEHEAKLITVFPTDRKPGECEECEDDYLLSILAYDDYETEHSTKIKVKEVASTSLKDLPLPGWAGWIKITEIDNATSCGIDNAPICGFILIEEKGGGRADALPLFRNY